MIAAETGRLILRHLGLEDLDELAAIEADPEVMRFYPSGPRSRDQTRGDILRCMEIQAGHGFSLYRGRLQGRRPPGRPVRAACPSRSAGWPRSKWPT